MCFWVYACWGHNNKVNLWWPIIMGRHHWHELLKCTLYLHWLVILGSFVTPCFCWNISNTFCWWRCLREPSRRLPHLHAPPSGVLQAHSTPRAWGKLLSSPCMSVTRRQPPVFWYTQCWKVQHFWPASDSLLKKLISFPSLIEYFTNSPISSSSTVAYGMLFSGRWIRKIGMILEGKRIWANVTFSEGNTGCVLSHLE